jgi:outer membrane protein OmpA-like peptidoglycan-associated protein
VEAPVIDRLVTAIQTRDPVSVGRLLGAAGTMRLPQLGLAWTGPAAQAAFAELVTAFPDLKWHPAHRYEAPSQTVEEGVWSGTHTGPLGGIPPTGRDVRIRARVIYEYSDDNVRRVEVSTDLSALFLELGVERPRAAVTAAAFAPVHVPEQVQIHEQARPAAPAPTDTPKGRHASGVARRRSRLLIVGLVVVLLAGLAVALVGRSHPTRLPPVAARISRSPSPSPSPTPHRGRSANGVTSVGNKLILSADVLFDTNSATLSPRAKAVIAQVAAILLHRHVTGGVRVDGYSDNVGTAAYNLQLSQRRAAAVVAALRRAAPSAQITYVAQGFGEADPVASNATAAGRRLNRRVTIVLPHRS